MLTGVILAKNEEATIQKCIETLKFCDNILVIDDYSTDQTAKIAKTMGVQVVKHHLEGDFGQQRNWAISQVSSGWILFIDADELVGPELQKEILQAILKIEYKGFKIPRRDLLWGKRLNYGDVGNVKLLRLARKGTGEWKGKVHEVWQIEGRVGQLKSEIFHYPHQNLEEFLKHINYYSTLKAEYFYKHQRKVGIFEVVLGPIWRFIEFYIVKLGILDGVPGFIHATVMAGYTFLVTGKLFLLYRGIPNE
jgi:glycosyltransferase involved in cell wall biosynthesis